MKKYLSLITVLIIATCGNLQAQDIHFSQFYENAILRNPALTGIFSGDYKAGVNVRNQWSSIGVPFVTVLGSVESRVAINKEVGDYLSFGLTATYDKAGSIGFTTMQVFPALNFNKCLEDAHQSYISVGFTGGYIQRAYDLSKMSVSNQWIGGAYSPDNPTNENITNNKIQHYDLSAGISFNSSIGANNRVNYYLGAAGYHLTKPKEAFNASESFVRLGTRWTGNLGVQAMLTSDVALTVHVNYQNQYPYQELIGGGLLSWSKYDVNQSTLFTFYAGCFYRLNDAIIPTVKLDYKHYSFVVSYDATSSSLRTASEGVGGFELSLYARGKFKRNLTGAEQVRCPRFEKTSAWQNF